MMKYLKLLFVVFVGASSQHLAVAQDGIPEPEFNARPYYLSDGELKDLERADASFDVKIKGIGYGGADYFYIAFGSKSTERFSNDNLPRVFIKLAGNVDPEELLLIVREETKKKKKDRRRFKQGSRSLGGRARDVSENQVTFSIKKIRDGVYEVVFENDLEPGEYAFMPVSDANINPLTAGSTKTKITCFGID